MSLLMKMESVKMAPIDVLDSITEQLHILFSNRLDVYWSYDAKNKKVVGVHELFKLNKFSEAFLWDLARTIEIWEPRIKRAVCSWTFSAPEIPILNLHCVLKDSPHQKRSFTFPLKDL